MQKRLLLLIPGMVRLRNVGLSRAYRKNLTDAGLQLLRRVSARGHVVSKDTPPQKLDAWLEEAVEEAHAEGERLYWVTIGVLGVQRSFKLSGPLLRGTWRAVKGWRSLQPVRSRVPISAFCLEACVVDLIRAGWKEEGWLRMQLWSAALGLWLGFSALLRPSEVLNLKVSDISFSNLRGRTGMDPGVVVVVRNPKTRRIWHRQFVLCRDERLEDWLKWWVAGLSRSRPLFPLTRYVWAKHFGHCLERLHLTNCHFTLGSLRAGGATSHFRKFGNLGELQFHGRWSSQAALQFYLQEAFSTHVESSFSNACLEKLDMLHRFIHVLGSTPTQSRRVLAGFSESHEGRRRQSFRQGWNLKSDES